VQQGMAHYGSVNHAHNSHNASCYFREKKFEVFQIVAELEYKQDIAP
jgi:hypothetical protein